MSDTRAVFDEAWRFAVGFDQILVRRGGAPLAGADLPPTRRLNDADAQLNHVRADLAQGFALNDERVFAAMAHLVALVVSQRRVEELRVESGSEAA